MQLTIREARITDLDAITHIEATCFPVSEAASRTRLEQRLHTFSTSFFVAESEGKLIGFINGAITDSPTISDIMFEDATYHHPNGCYQSIFGLDVLPDYQHQGVAIRLMNHLIASAKAQGKKGLILTCKEKLISFYNQFGYENQGLSESAHGGAVWYDMTLLF